MKNILKKELSIVLAVLMIMTAWVFVAPQKAEAAQGTYYFKWTFKNTNSNMSMETSGTTLYPAVKTNSGTGSNTKATDSSWSWSSSDVGTGSTRTYQGSTSQGFPIGIYGGVYNSNSTYGVNTEMHFYVSGDNSSWTELWSVSKSDLISKKSTLNLNNYWYGVGGGTSYNQVTANAWPVLSVTVGSTAGQSVTVPASGSANSTTATSCSAMDSRYNVKWYTDPSWVVSASSSGATSSASLSGISAGSGCVTVNNNAKTYCSGSASKTVYLNAVVGSTKSSVITVTVNNIKYTNTYSWVTDGGTTYSTKTSTQTQYYGMSLSAPATPGNHWDATNHYIYKGWSPTIGNCTGANTYTAQYTSGAHSWVYTGTNGSGTHTRTCSVCGYKETGVACSGGTATCTSPKTCDYCKTTYGSALGHSITAVSKKAATCTEDGNIAYWTCSRCNNYFSDSGATTVISKDSITIPKLGHKFPLTAIAAVSPTCTTGGNIAYYKCEQCGKYYKDSSATTEVTLDGTKLPANGHTLTATAAKAPTCTENGNTAYWYCTVCNKYFSDAAATTETTLAATVVSATGHDYTDATPVSSGNGTHKLYCKNGCGTYQTANCTYTATIKTAATCVSEGVHTYTCVCGYSYDKADIVRLDHSYTGEMRNNNDGTHSFKCVNGCGKYGATTSCTKAETEVTVEATCTTKGTHKYTCTCGYTWTAEDITALGHKLTAVAAVAATCEADGNIAYWHCSRCDKYYSNAAATKEITQADTVLTKLGHDYTGTLKRNNDGTHSYLCKNGCGTYGNTTDCTYTSAVTTEPTCTKDGVRTYTCSVCSYSYTETINKLGHELTAVEAKEPTCTEAGNIAYWYCSRCDKYFTDAECTTAVAQAKTVLAALGHDWTIKDDKSNVAQKDEDKHTVTCARCGAVTSNLDHNYGAAVTTAPTCTTDGYDTYVCPDCGQVKVNNVKSALGHSFTNYVSDGNATCLENGTETAKCDRCDVTDTKTEKGSALGHKAAATVVENNVDPTCLKAGSYDNVVYCERCSAELSRTTITVKALGHSFTDYKYNNDATCLKDGTETAKCDRCDVTDTRTVKDSALGHDYIDHEAKDATCTEIGWYAYKTCSRCDYTTYKEIPAKGHVKADAVVENKVEPTCTEDGSYDSVVYCSVCDAELSRTPKTIEKLGHIWGEEHEEDRVEATCTEDGSYNMVVRCERCNEILQSTPNTILKKGHTPMEGVKENVVEPTCTLDGSYEINVYCSVCDALVSSKTYSITRLGHKKGESQVENEVEATCTTAGSYDTVVRCTVCNEILSSKTTEIPKLGHKAGAKVIENQIGIDCTHDGTYDEVIYCTVCGEEISRKTIHQDALGHTAGSTVIENQVEPTCTENGSYDKVVYCSVCNAEISRKTVKVAATNHKFVQNAVEATCTVDGSIVTVCTVCGECVTEVIKAKGHIDENNDNVCDVCGKTITGDCNCFCHDPNAFKGFNGIIHKILLFFWKLFNVNKYCDCGVAHY